MTETLWFSVTGSPVLNIDDKQANNLVDPQLLEKLKHDTDLKPFNLSIQANDLLRRISVCPASLMALRKVIRRDIGQTEDLDPNEYPDLAFIQNIGLY